MALCNNCPRKCNIDRSLSNGFCGVKDEIKVARAGLHFGEEPCISGTKGSGTIFFSGCPLKCVFCQNHEISHNGFGQYISENKFIEIVSSLEKIGAHNINLVTPTHYFCKLHDIFSKYKPSIPIVYNSSGYEKTENIEYDIADIYLFDLKFFSREKSLRYANCGDYFDVAVSAIKKAIEIKGKPIFDSDGIMKSGVIVRHMILPQNTNESIALIESISDLANDIVFSLMSQYTPLYKAEEYSEINRTITKREYNKVLDKCFNLNFFEFYTQKLNSATTKYIPKFDLSGII